MVSALCTSLDRVLATNHSIFAPNDAGWNHQCCGSHSTFLPNHSEVPETGRFSCRLESGEHPNYTIGHHITANDINAGEYDCQKIQYSNYIFVGPYIGDILTAHAPEYVVLGETVSYSFERLSTALCLVAAGARFLATNPDVVGSQNRELS